MEDMALEDEEQRMHDAEKSARQKQKDLQDACVLFVGAWDEGKRGLYLDKHVRAIRVALEAIGR